MSEKWFMHIVKSEDKLVLEWQKYYGECRKECKALASLCTDSFLGKEDVIRTLIKKSAPLAKLQKAVCLNQCKQKKLPSLTKWQDEEFKENPLHVAQTTMEGMRDSANYSNLKMFKPGEIQDLPEGSLKGDYQTVDMDDDPEL